MACHSGLAQPATQSLRARELPSLFVWRTASELRSVQSAGRRFSVYVPEELVPELRRCVDNGRTLQELLQEAAPRYVKALKRERANTSKSKKS